MKLKSSKILFLIVIIAFIYGIKHYNLQSYLSFSYIQENLDLFQNYYADNTFEAIGIFMAIYIISTALAIPGAAILTLAAGALFGKLVGTVVANIAATIGATLSFLLARFFLREFIQKRFGDKLKVINEGIKRDGGTYLLTLRLIPLFPFFLINVLMGLTPIRVTTFFFVSQIGMLAGTFVYVNAGEEISKITSLKEIFTPNIVVAFCLLGVFPLIAKQIIAAIKARKVYRKYSSQRPKSFEYNMVAIGGGAAGLVTCYVTAAVKAKAALIEKHKMGGDCLNTGCVPSKALIQTAKILHQSRQGDKYGLQGLEIPFDFKDVMAKVKQVIKEIEPHDSAERYSKLGVDCFTGEAKILSPWEIAIGGRRITTKNITIATGAEPAIIPIKGLEQINFIDSNNLWELTQLPQKLVVLGGGPIGLEMAQSFRRMGSEVCVIEMAEQIMAKEDFDVGQFVAKRLTEEGIQILVGHKAMEIKKGRDFHEIICQTSQNKKVSIPFDQILMATGRRPRTKGFGLEELGIEINGNGTIAVNEYLQTNYPNIYACGDVAGPYQLTHMASHQAWYCAVNGLFGKFKRFKVDYSAVPWATYTDPEVATVGQMEDSLKAMGVAYDVAKYDISDLDRAITDRQDYGFVKICTAKGKDRILGATIVGPRASDYIIEFIMAIKYGLGTGKILSTIHPYPSMAEANKYVAGRWREMNKPKKLLELLERFFRWQRS